MSALTREQQARSALLLLPPLMAAARDDLIRTHLAAWGADLRNTHGPQAEAWFTTVWHHRRLEANDVPKLRRLSQMVWQTNPYSATAHCFRANAIYGLERGQDFLNFYRAVFAPANRVTETSEVPAVLGLVPAGALKAFPHWDNNMKPDRQALRESWETAMVPASPSDASRARDLSSVIDAARNVFCISYRMQQEQLPLSQAFIATTRAGRLEFKDRTGALAETSASLLADAEMYQTQAFQSTFVLDRVMAGSVEQHLLQDLAKHAACTVPRFPRQPASKLRELLLGTKPEECLAVAQAFVEQSSPSWATNPSVREADGQTL